MPKKKDGVKSTSGRGKLTDKQKRFVEEYLIDLNATQAAIRTGYKKETAYSQGQRLLKNVEIQQAISEAQNKRSARVEVSQDFVIQKLLKNIAISMGEESTIETIPAKTPDGEMVGNDIACFKFEPSAANKALELLGKHLGMFKDRVDITSAEQPILPSLKELFSEH
ncbi:terminase [Pasteurellaceae bacterium Macca]|nr:terminase [Pasteurellaceae bacterium Macca]MCK3656166.1 terminase [Pasteurellaceae bacterium Macca]